MLVLLASSRSFNPTGLRSVAPPRVYPRRVLGVSMAEKSWVVRKSTPLVGQVVAAGVAQHVRLHMTQAGSFADVLMM